MKLPSREQMRALDRAASEKFSIPGQVLMENAGLGTVFLMERELGPPAGDSFAAILVGPGNNGGDGLVIGRHLHQRGCRPLFFLLTDPATLGGDAAANLRIVERLGLPLHHIASPEEVAEINGICRQYLGCGRTCYAVVDALFGIGLCREVGGVFAAAIEMVNQETFLPGVPVVAVDIPSGLDADSGMVHGCCLRADHTATYGWAKPGLFAGGEGWAGKVAIIDIGIPPETLAGTVVATELATPESVAALARPLWRQAAAHKGRHGHLLLLAGATGMTGAAILAARGALHAGAGLVSLAVPADLNPIFEAALPEAMTHPLPGSRGLLAAADLAAILALAEDKSAVVLGPGIGQSETTVELVLALYGRLCCPLLLDADALNAIAAQRRQLPPPGAPRLFTPHPGEMGRLLSEDTRAIADDRLAAARRGQALFAGQGQPVVMVLKGAATVTVASDGLTTINSSGNPGMACGGMGDVLSGVIGALICQGLSPDAAAVAGVYLHGVAGDILAGRRGVGFVAGEVAAELPLARQRLLSAAVPPVTR
jgi:ADP-dependent NAD(P)H-hydrate dehydratase / NAD(P)H-hydrate epimerase